MKPPLKVLLLNPPFGRRYLRDQFCSHVSKGSYYWQPLDLLLVSARLHASGYALAVVDAVAEGLSPDETRRRVAAFGPHALVFLTGSDSVTADLALVEDLKNRGATVAVGIGDILRASGECLMAEYPALDACLNDFVLHGLEAFLQGRVEEAWNMTVRTAGGIRRVPLRGQPKTFTIPTPPYERFPLSRYRMPHNRHHPYAAVISSTGCPYACGFCPFANTPYRSREVGDILINLEAVRAMGIRQVHFADWTFAVDRGRAMELLRGMIGRDFGFTWSCLSRVDLMDQELLAVMRRAGCDLVEFGVESGSQAILDRHEKNITLEEIRRAFRWAHDQGMATLATFVLGLPGETHASLEQSLRLALELDPTFCSFNAASPRLATTLRQDLIAGGLLDESIESALDSSHARPSFSTRTLSADDVDRFRRHAIRRFYLRPAYLVKRARRLRSWIEVQNHFSNGISVARQAMRV